MKKLSNTFLCIILFIFFPMAVNASDPILYFSDITSGPKTGLNDGLGEGAIVTVWGVNLGSSKGSSTITIDGVPAAHVYYWENADPGIGDSGPADMYTYHKMQEIAFSIPSAASDGRVTIRATVNGVASNELDFTIRSGNIYYVKSTGSNSTGDGSWTNPWLNVDYYSSGACSKSKLNAGDIIYACDGVTDTGTYGLVLKNKAGTGLDMPISLIAYPGADYRVGNGNYGIGNHNASCAYWNFSKIFVQSDGTGIGGFKGMRVIGCEITDIVCAQGASGAISGAGDNADGGIKCLGNYIHDFGGPCTTSWHHVFYLSNRSGKSIKGFELGWNYLRDNDAYGALHVYDEGICGGWTGIISLHDNVVIDQVQEGFGVSLACDEPTGPEIVVYNNLFVNCAKNGSDCISGLRSTNTSNIKFYNNTIYGYGSNDSGRAIYIQANGSGTWNFGGTWSFYNNIIVDTKGRPFEDPIYADVPDTHGNNLFYSTVGGVAVPPWAISPITENPLFVNCTTNFNLQSNSPAKDAGASVVSSIVKKDIIGISRPQGGGYDIGAYEYDEGGEPPPPPPEDNEDPTIAIISPTTASEYEVSVSTISISGTASDNVEVQGVSWKQNGGATQDATGTTNWSIPSVMLVEGANTIVVTATDTSGNTADDTIVITYTKPEGTYTKTFGNVPDSDYPGTVQDTYNNTNPSNQNYSSSTASINTYTWPAQTSANTIILKWDLSSIPNNAIITDAKLYLYQSESGGDSDYVISVHKIMNHNPQVSACTWDTFDGVHSWTGGSTGGLQDIAAPEDIKQVSLTNNEYKVWSVTSMVQQWVSNPAINFGMLLSSDQTENKASVSSHRYFIPTENADTNKRPKLVVSYTTSSGGAPPGPPTLEIVTE